MCMRLTSKTPKSHKHQFTLVCVCYFCSFYFLTEFVATQLLNHEESSPSVAADQRSLSQPRLTVGSPDHRISRKLSPVEIYYEMRTRRNSVTSSVR